MAKRTKIICTLGPAVDSESALKNLLQAGMDVARCNFSHGSHAEHKARMDRLKKVRRELDSPCALMLDTKGPAFVQASWKAANQYYSAQEIISFLPKKISSELPAAFINHSLVFITTLSQAPSS